MNAAAGGIADAGVVVYGTAWCGYCAAARRLLATKGVPFHEIDIDEAPSRRQEMIERSGRHTVPQVFIGRRHIGGYSDLAALEREGRLDELLAPAGESTKEQRR